MRLSTRGRYAVNAMVELAVNYRGTPVSVRTISRRQGVSASYLEQLLYRLGKSGLVESARGPAGGFSLKRSPEKINILEIIEALGESVAPGYCVDEKRKRKQCSLVDSCVSRLLWEKLKESIKKILCHTTLEDLRQEAVRKMEKQMPGEGYVFNI